MDITGAIKVVGKEEVISSSFKKRVLILETQDQYPQVLSIEFVQDKTDLLDGFGMGEVVNVGINLRGREWTNPQGEIKYFNTIQGWRISKSSGESSAPVAQPMGPVAGTGVAEGEDEDDLPF